METPRGLTIIGTHSQNILRRLLLRSRSRQQLGHLYWLASVAIAWAIIGHPALQAQHLKAAEYEVKAAYLYNFSRFVEWPAKVTQAQSDSFTICVLGQNPFGSALVATVANETITGQSVIAKQIPAAPDAVNCRVLFISSSEEGQLKQILASLGSASVLTVSDLPQFTDRGGMVQFLLENGKVRFEVNLAPAQRAGLTLSSELLKVAVNVRKKSQPGD